MKQIPLLILAFLYVGQIGAQFTLDLEAGVSFNTKNSVRYPNAELSMGDQVDIPKQFGTGSTLFYRIRASHTIDNRHTISALYAPLLFETKGAFSEAIQFGEALFDPEDKTTVAYKFNSYRLTYRYRLVESNTVIFGLGLTTKIRDARIEFRTNAKAQETTDVGFVPLINFRLDLFPLRRLTFTLNGDALVGPEGRAEDVFGGFEYELTETISIKTGYRILEGGADVDQVYNFSLIHYAAVGVTFTF